MLRTPRLALSATAGFSIFFLGLFAAMAPNAAAATLSCDPATLGAALPASLNATITSATALTTPVSYCDVVGTIATSTYGQPGSVGFEVGLPVTWNGRFLFIGGGGYVGSLLVGDSEFPPVLEAGFAAATTDAGHESELGPLAELDGSYALLPDGQPNQAGREDFADRAVHLSTVVGQTLAEAYYEVSAMNSYFDGCSTGGRQAMVEAQKYPTDYHGIVAGDPAIGYPIAGFNWNDQALLANTDNYLPPAKVELLDSAVLAECDDLDGVPDGLIQDPRKCHFDPASIECSSGDEPTCLTAGQVATVDAIYSGAKTSIGQQLYPGYTASDPGGPDGWEEWITGFVTPTFGVADPWGTTPLPSFEEAPFQWSFQDQFMKYYLFDNPNADSLSFDFGNYYEVLQLVKLSSAYQGNGQNPNLQPFFSHGGKLLMYHGWSDPALTPFVSVDYYTSAAKAANAHPSNVHYTSIFKFGMSADAQASGGLYDILRENARLFMVPGMHHCSGGPGPNVFDPLSPLIEWAEGGPAPDGIIAAHYPNNDGTPPPDRTMPLCAYPETAVYDGTGNVDLASSWTCEEPSSSYSATSHKVKN
ncbi:MAG TPA: tannase/feruloyl esterase family alpha/beta hydrolase [Candidatus Binataceae bacterium]|nr:tannase/feruloyl esterase family alpha/beta hydrolase [Candidatus Binataceae bacterium]